MNWNGLELPSNPYFHDESVIIYQANFKDTLNELPNDSIDLIPTSPPYNCRKPYPSGDELPWSEWYDDMHTFLEHSYRVLQLGGTIAINLPGVVRWQREHKFTDSWGDFDPTYKTHQGNKKTLGKGRVEPIGFNLLAMMREQDSHIREPIVWVKGSEGNAICSDYRMGCDSDPYMRPAHEMILLGSKGRWFHRGGTGRRGKDAVPFIDYTKDVWHIPPVSNNGHPAVFPEELPKRLILLFTHAMNSIVLDPFLGSGTTIIASTKLNRKCVGIERDEKYCEMATLRYLKYLATREETD